MAQNFSNPNYNGQSNDPGFNNGAPGPNPANFDPNANFASPVDNTAYPNNYGSNNFAPYNPDSDYSRANPSQSFENNPNQNFQPTNNQNPNEASFTPPNNVNINTNSEPIQAAVNNSYYSGNNDFNNPPDFKPEPNPAYSPEFNKFSNSNAPAQSYNPQLEPAYLNNNYNQNNPNPQSGPIFNPSFDQSNSNFDAGSNNPNNQSNYNPYPVDQNYNNNYQAPANTGFENGGYVAAAANNYPNQDPNFNQQAANGYTDPYLQQNQNPYPDKNNPNGKNTFEVKKSGSRTVLLAAIGIVVVLLIVTLVLFFLMSNRRKNQTPPPTTDSNNLSGEIVSSSTTSQEAANSSQQSKASEGGSKQGTPADQAKVKNETKLTSDWLKQKFNSKDLDDSGNCKTTTVCGENADKDNDGLINIEEYNYDLDPLNEDVDSDGLSDGDEIYVYLTSPKEKDSNNNKLSDSEEVVSCFDPILIGMKEGKLSPSRLESISSSVGLRPLRETTIKTLNKAGAVKKDIENGYLESKCIGSSVNFGTGTSKSSSANSSK